MANIRIPQNYVEKDIKRSMCDLDQAKYTTMMQGMHIPVKFEKMYPKDKFGINYHSILDSLPMAARLLNGWRLRILCFKSSLSNYYSWMDNNSRITSEEYRNRRHHIITNKNSIAPSAGASELLASVYPLMLNNSTELESGFTSFNLFYPFTVLPSPSSYARPTISYVKAFGVQAGSFLDYYGVPAKFITSDYYNSDDPYNIVNSMNADKVLCYLDAIRNYCVNNQLESVPYTYTYPVFDVFKPTAGEYKISNWVSRISNLELKAIDDFIKAVRMQENGVDLLALCDENLSTFGSAIRKWLYVLRYGGLFLCEFEPDMLNTLLLNVSTNDISVQTTGGRFTINFLRLKNRDQLLQDRIDVAGGRWSRLLRSIWGSKTNGKMDIPELIGVTSQFVNPKGVISSANTDTDNSGSGSSLGQLGSIVTDKDSSFTHEVYSEDYSMLFFIASLVPDVAYSNGLDKDNDIINFADDYTPQFDNLGYQTVPRYKYNALPEYSFANEQYVVGTSGIASYLKPMGKNVAWLDMISNVDRCHGKLATDAYFEPWVLKRKFSVAYEGTDDTLPEDQRIVWVDTPEMDFTSYVNPYAFQYPFIAQSNTDDNFVFQIGFNIEAIRPKGKWYMPTLGD